MRWTFGRKIGLGFTVTGIGLIVLAVVGYRAVTGLIDNESWVAHTHEVLREIAKVESLAVDAETSERGYIITGETMFLDPFNEALAALDKHQRALRVQIADNPEQSRRSDELRTELAAVTDRFKAVIEQRKQSAETAIAAVGSGTGFRLMNAARATMREMEAEERQLLADRDVRAAETVSFAKTVIVFGSLSALILAVVIGVVLVRSLNAQIGAAVQQVTSSSTELQAAANQQASSAREQATAMTEIATTITELLATSRQIAESSQRVSAVAGQTVTAVRAGGGTVEKTNDASATVRRQVDQIVTHMLDLGKKSQQVGQVLDIVGELAEQTNILAINATIEAAGAGEGGRRFGVVADEIRKLADRVGASTKEIRGMVDDVRGATNATIMATEAGSKAVDAGTAQMAETAVAFKQIGSLVSTTTDAAREIELSTKQQASAVEQVNAALGSVVQAARETEASASETLQTSRQLTSLSSELLRMVNA